MSEGAGLRILVLQWAHDGRTEELERVEDHLTAIARRYGEVTRDRGAALREYTTETPPDEVHLLEFATEGAFDAFLADPDRAEWSARLREAMTRTLVVRLLPLESDER